MKYFFLIYFILLCILFIEAYLTKITDDEYNS